MSHYYIWNKPEWRERGVFVILEYLKEHDKDAIVHDFFRSVPGAYYIELENVKDKTLKDLHLEPVYDETEEGMTSVRRILNHLDNVENPSETNGNAKGWREKFNKWKETGIYEYDKKEYERLKLLLDKKDK